MQFWIWVPLIFLNIKIEDFLDYIPLIRIFYLGKVIKHKVKKIYIFESMLHISIHIFWCWYLKVKTMINNFFYFIYFFNVYLFWESVRVGKGQREGERENPKQAPHCQLRAQHRAWSHNLGSWPEPKSRVGHSTDWAIQVPQ